MSLVTLRSSWQRSVLTAFSQLSIPHWTVPFVLFGVCYAAYGLVIPYLGLYFDDWHHVYYAFARGIDSLWELLLYDNRPTAAIYHIVFFQIIGFRPMNWHVLAFILRFFTVLMTWLSLQAIWPDHKREATWVALLFAVYPLFKFQPVAVAYSLHWAAYLLFSISIWAMIESVRKPRYYWLFLFLSLTTGSLHLFLLEYFAGIEMIRPVILWMMIEKKNGFSRVKKIFQYLLPYLLLFILFAVYRVLFMPVPEGDIDRNLPRLIFEFTESPLAATFDLMQTVLQDMVSILYSVWNSVFSPKIFVFSQSANLKIMFMVLVVGTALFFYLSYLRIYESESSRSGTFWYREAFWVGLIWTLLGPLPAWITVSGITLDNVLWSNRYGLASMVGASLFIVAVAEGLIGNKIYRTIFYCVLVSFAVGWHARNSNDFRWAWTKQSRFYSQLYWRAPYILPGTAILSDGEIFPQMTENSTSYALGALYPSGEIFQAYKYWFYGLYGNFNEKREDLVAGMPLMARSFSSSFSGTSHDSLVIYYEPEKNQCLWVLRPEDRDIRILPEITREAVVISNLDRIEADSPMARPMPSVIFGEATEQTWCYFYQKADLARQYRDWERIVELWDEADEIGFTPGNGVEYIPFIEGYAYQTKWDKAREMTFMANRITSAMHPILCATWDRIEAGTSDSTAREDALLSVRGRLRCGQ